MKIVREENYAVTNTLFLLTGVKRFFCWTLAIVDEEKDLLDVSFVLCKDDTESKILTN